MGSAVGVIRHAAQLAAFSTLCACAFRAEVEVGQDHPPTNAGSGGAPGAGGSGGGPAGMGGGLFGPDPSMTACELGEQHIGAFVMPSDSPDKVGSGVGGVMIGGEYRLRALVEHGACGCFDANAEIAQTLVVGDGDGYVISDYRANGWHWAARFGYRTFGNHIVITTYCQENGQRMSTAGPFGPFDTYTVSGESLWFFSRACNYSAEYQRLPPPPAR